MSTSDPICIAAWKKTFDAFDASLEDLISLVTRDGIERPEQLEPLEIAFEALRRCMSDLEKNSIPGAGKVQEQYLSNLYKKTNMCIALLLEAKKKTGKKICMLYRKKRAFSCYRDVLMLSRE